MKEKISFWYKTGLWTLEMVRSAVEKKKISAKDFKEITGQAFQEGA